MKIYDFDNVILGRACTSVAKALLNGEDIIVVNCEKAVIRGTREGIMEKFVRRSGWRAKGNPKKGPKYARTADKLVSFSIRNMLPDKKASGLKRLRHLQVYIGVPKKLEGQSFEKPPAAQNGESKRFMRMAQISAALGIAVQTPPKPVVTSK